MRQRGWYLDPDGDGERWHDGTRWTGVTRPTVESAARLASREATEVRRHVRERWRRRSGVAALLMVSLVGAVGLTAVLAPGQVKSVAEAFGIGRPHRLLPAVKPDVRSPIFAIEWTDWLGDPVTYDPCKPLRYVINPAGAPPDYRAFIDPAIEKAQAASGIKFVFEGLSADTWSTRDRATTSVPVLISFAPSLDVTTAHADAVGLGGSTVVTSNGRKQPHYLTGQVELLSSWFAKESRVHATGAEESVVMHELGHVLGLGHVRDPREVMYPESRGLTEYGPGDLTGLARLGAGYCAG